MVEEQFISSGEVRKRTGLSDGTIRRMAIAGQIPGFRIGRRFRFKLSDINALVQSSKLVSSIHKPEDDARV